MRVKTDRYFLQAKTTSIGRNLRQITRSKQARRLSMWVKPLTGVGAGMNLGIPLNWFHQGELRANVKRNAKNHQGRDQHTAVPERQTHAQPVKKASARLLCVAISPALDK